MILILSIVALAFSIIGNLLVNYKKKMGFIIWTVSNVFWIAVNVLGNLNYPQVVMYLIYVGLNLQGYKNWSKRDEL